jgi:hypothetical protein
MEPLLWSIERLLSFVVEIAIIAVLIILVIRFSKGAKNA